MTRLAALVACGLALVALVGLLCWTANLAVPWDLNLCLTLLALAVVVSCASTLKHLTHHPRQRKE